MFTSSWKKVKLKDIVTLNSAVLSANWSNNRILYLDTASVTNNQFEAPQSLTYKNAPSRAKRIVKHGDTIISTVRPSQNHFGFLNHPPANLIVSTGFAVLTPKGLYPKFLYYLVTQKSITEYLNSVAETTTTAYPAFSPQTLLDIEFQIPPLPEQCAIAEVLSSLDDKIELNRRMNRTLEQLAQAIYKHMFIDNPEREGWVKGVLGDIAENVRIGVHPSSMTSFEPYIGLEHMPQKSISLNNWGNADAVNSNKFIFKKGQFLFGKLRPYFYKIGIAPVNGICSTDILVIEPKRQEFNGYLLETITSVDFVDSINIATEGTKMPRTNWPYMAKFPIFIPPINLPLVFNERVIPAFDLILANIQETRTLSELRDTLLPKLMSGQVMVKS